nr:ATP-binding protein [Galbitalea soli]
MTIRPDWCEVEAVVSAAVAVSSPDPGDTSVEVEPGIPTIWADHDRIEQVLVNLLDNAFKHGRAPISVRVRVAGESVVFDVIDSGSGIPADRSDDVFEPYVRRPASPGAGLGLAICRNIVLAHGGTLSAVAGARTGHVRLTLPLSAAPSTEGEPHV